MWYYKKCFLFIKTFYSNLFDIIKSTKNWLSVFAFYLRIKNEIAVKFRSSLFTLLLTETTKMTIFVFESSS